MFLAIQYLLLLVPSNTSDIFILYVHKSKHRHLKAVWNWNHMEAPSEHLAECEIIEKDWDLVSKALSSSFGYATDRTVTSIKLLNFS